jgi:hypothetical protein
MKKQVESYQTGMDLLRKVALGGEAGRWFREAAESKKGVVVGLATPISDYFFASLRSVSPVFQRSYAGCHSCCWAFQRYSPLAPNKRPRNRLAYLRPTLSR